MIDIERHGEGDNDREICGEIEYTRCCFLLCVNRIEWLLLLLSNRWTENKYTQSITENIEHQKMAKQKHGIDFPTENGPLESLTSVHGTHKHTWIQNVSRLN